MIKISFPNNKKFKDLLIIFKEKAIQTIGNDNAINVEQAFQNFISEYNSKKTRKKRNKIKSLINNIKSNKDIFENLFLISDCSLIVNPNNYYVKILKSIFDNIDITYKWNYFRRYKINEVLYAIFKLVDVRVCPYCNRTYIPVIQYSDKFLSPEMDHFYPKEKFPYLAFSFYNLIPICSTCNSRLKRSKDSNLLHPYKEGFGNNVKFKLHSNKEKNYLNLLSGSISNNNLFSIELIKKKDIDNNDDYIKRCKNSNTEFHIRDTYNIMHKQDAIDLVRKISLFRPSYKKSFVAIVNYHKNQDLENILNKKFKDIDNKDDFLKIIKDKLQDIDFDMLKLLFGNWLDESNDLKEPLSKFKRDIYQQFTSLHIDDYELL